MPEFWNNPSHRYGDRPVNKERAQSWNYTALSYRPPSLPASLISEPDYSWPVIAVIMLHLILLFYLHDRLVLMYWRRRRMQQLQRQLERQLQSVPEIELTDLAQDKEKYVYRLESLWLRYG